MALHPPAPAANMSLLPPASGWYCPGLGTWCASNLGCGQPQHCRHVGCRGELKIPGNGLKKKTEIPNLLWSRSAGPGTGLWSLLGAHREPGPPAPRGQHRAPAALPTPPAGQRQDAAACRVSEAAFTGFHPWWGCSGLSKRHKTSKDLLVCAPGPHQPGAPALSFPDTHPDPPGKETLGTV